MKFSDYLWALLPRPFKVKSGDDPPETKRWANALGEVFDDIKISAFALRRSWIASTSEGKALDFHGEERNLPRYPGESDELYKGRVLAAYEMYALGGTDPGIIRTLELLGYPQAAIYPLYKEEARFQEAGGRLLDGGWDLGTDVPLRAPDGVRDDWIGRWAEFALALRFGDRPFTLQDHKVLVDTINRVKASHSRLAEIGFTMNGRLYGPIGASWRNKLTTTYNCSDAWHNPTQILLSGATPWAEVELLLLDGVWDQDGEKRLDGYAIIDGWTLDQPTAAGISRVQTIGQVAVGGPVSDAWSLDGGGARYLLDGVWALTSRPVDGSRLLDGSWLLRARLLEEHRRWLDGARPLGLIDQGVGISGRGVLRRWWQGEYAEELIA